MLLLPALGPAGAGKKRLAIFGEVAFTGSAPLLYAAPVNGFVSTNGVAPRQHPRNRLLHMRPVASELRSASFDPTLRPRNQNRSGLCFSPTVRRRMCRMCRHLVLD